MFQVRETGDGLVIDMSARLELMDEADERITRHLVSRALPFRRFALRIVLREALLNAVIHGCGKDSDRRVCIELKVSEDAILLAVEDPGDGFDVHNRHPPAETLRDGGRGLSLMEIYSDQVTFNSRGNRVEIQMRLTPEVVAAADNHRPSLEQAP